MLPPFLFLFVQVYSIALNESDIQASVIKPIADVTLKDLTMVAGDLIELQFMNLITGHGVSDGAEATSASCRCAPEPVHT